MFILSASNENSRPDRPDCEARHVNTGGITASASLQAWQVTPVSSRFNAVISQLLGALETATGHEYLERFVQQIAELFATDWATIALIDTAHTDRLQTLTVYSEGRIGDNMEWPLSGSPGAEVINSAAPCIFRTQVQNKFPADQVLRQACAFCYTGVPLFATGGEIIGLFVLMDRQTIVDELLAVEVLQLFADRVVAEIERLYSDSEIQQHQRLLEERINRDGAELEMTRHQLEDLCHSVSHDLRGPLRAIDGFSEALATDYADKLDETAADYLRRIRKNIRQMDELLHALLVLSRVTRHRLCLSEVNLSRICARSIARLQQRDPQRRVAISIQTDMHACSDPELMSIALDHLVDNAWKFTAGSDSARIEFSVDRQGEVPVYRITDNGVGFNMVYLDKLFQLFQRLHGQSSYAGVGAGLATAKRIIERHGGTLWTEAEPGVGASFYFTLPLSTAEGCGDPAITTAP